MAVLNYPKRASPPAKDLIPIGAHVDIIGGSYPGHWAVIVGHTAKKYHVRLDTGYVTALKQTNVKLSEKQAYSKSPREPKNPTYRALIKTELSKIEASVEAIKILMDKIKLEEEGGESQVDGSD